MSNTIYLKDFNHMKRVQKRLVDVGYYRRDGGFGFYSGSEYIRGDKVIIFGSIGSKYTITY